MHSTRSRSGQRCVPATLHRDVKCNNIVLGSNYEAYLADFGLAKLMNSPNYIMPCCVSLVLMGRHCSRVWLHLEQHREERLVQLRPGTPGDPEWAERLQADGQRQPPHRGVGEEDG